MTGQDDKERCSESTPLLSPLPPIATELSLLTKNGVDAPHEDDPPTWNEETTAIFAMAWRVSITTFCRISLSTISTAFLGHLGPTELAASALAGIWTNAAQMLILGFAVSLNTLCGQACGARNYELVGIWLQLGLIFVTIFSIPAIVSFFYVDKILAFVTDDAEVLRLADVYARLISPTVLAQAYYCAMRQYLMAQEIVDPPTIISVLSVGVCLISNYVFIYGVGPIPGFHFIGSAIAQIVASYFQPIALWGYAFAYKGYHRKTWYGWDIGACLQWSRVRSFISLSVAMTLNLALDEWVYNALSAIAGTFGAVNLAANSVLFSLWGLIFGLYWGFALPCQVRCANYLGAYRPRAAKRVAEVGFVLGGLAAAISSFGVLIFRTYIIQLFTNDQEITQVLNQVMPVFCLAVFVSGLHVILAAVFEAMSLATTLVAITVVGSWVIMMPASYVLGIQMDGGLIGLWWGSVVGEGAKFGLISLALYLVDWARIARRAVKQSEGEVLNREEIEMDVAMRSTYMGFSTPSMGGMSPVMTGMTTPSHSAKDAHMRKEMRFDFESSGYTPRSSRHEDVE